MMMLCDDVYTAAPRMMSEEKRLIKYLLERYQEVGVIGRPVFNQSDTIKVGYGLSLIQILGMDEKDQVLTTNVWSRYVSNLPITTSNYRWRG